MGFSGAATWTVGEQLMRKARQSRGGTADFNMEFSRCGVVTDKLQKYFRTTCGNKYDDQFLG